MNRVFIKIYTLFSIIHIIKKYIYSHRTEDNDYEHKNYEFNIKVFIRGGRMMIDGKLKLRQLNDNEDDYKMLEKWYQAEEIYSHFEQRKLNYKEIKEKYFPRTLKDAKIPVYMIEYDKMPIGIIQYQLISYENKELYNINFNNCYEIDIFIGELTMHNKGIGKKAIDLLSKFLFIKKNAEILVMCPLKENVSAIRCYEKCGFKINNSFKIEDTIGNLQEYLLMIKEQ